MLSNLERSLLLHYTEDERFVGPHVRSDQHIRLLAMGYIKEHMIDPGNVLIIVTRAGYAALGDGPTAA